MRPVLFALLLLLPRSALSDEVAEWAYAGDQGPEHWAALSGEYEVCATGRMQSPIDLSHATPEGTIALTTQYAPVPLSILVGGHTVQVAGEGGGTYEEDGIRYDLLQGHFHAPSEHLINGNAYPLEFHLVHQSEAGDLGVLGVFIEEGPANGALNAIIDNIPAEAGTSVPIDGEVFDASDFLPAEAAMYGYSGSLTTPPCSEGVAWHIFTRPITASAEQIQALAAIMNNARPVQELHDRLVVGPAD